MSHGSSFSPRQARSWSKVMGLLMATTLACSVSGAAQQLLATVTPGGAAAVTTGSLKAAASSPVSVELSWEPVAGASQYSIELAVAGLDSLTVAQLPGDATSYEDFPAPPATELTYRVQAATSGGSVEVGSATLTTPAESPNPLVVEVNYEQNTFTIPTYDPTHPYVDPSTFLPEGFDPENPDLSLLQPGPKIHTQEIGPQGGTMEVTAADGVKYTLTVPAGAVPFSMLFGLTPVTSIDGLPLSGGLIGAVRIEPEGIEFSQPLVLEITPPAEAPPLLEGNIAIGFAVTSQNEGSEFFFLPSQEQTIAGVAPHQGGRLASLASGPVGAGPLAGVRLKIVDGKVVGVDSGPVSEVHNTVKNHPPSNPKDRTSSKIAAEQEEELAPVPDREGLGILKEATQAGSTDQFLQTLNDFQAYLDAGRTSVAEAIWDEILVNTKAMFELEKVRCFTQDGFRAAGVAARMSFDDSPFWSQFAERYVKKYGEKSLDEARAFAQRCKLSLKVDSHMTYIIAAVSITYDATIDIKPLLMSYGFDRESAKYGPYLKGYALVYPTKIEFKDSQCHEVTLKPFPTAFIRIGLKPVFDGEGNILHFSVVDFGGGGERETLTQKCDDSTNTALIASPSGGTWGGLFVDARHGQVFFDLSPLSSPPPTSGEIARIRFRKTAEPGLSGALFTEDTTFKVVIGE